MRSFIVIPSRLRTSFALIAGAALVAGCALGTGEPGAEGAGSSEAAGDEPIAEAEQAIGLRDVGVIPDGSTCFTGSERITIHMDDEDTSNSNFHDGWHGAIVSTGNTTLVFCRADGNLFRPLTNAEPYAVLKLGMSCPIGSTEFSRTFDNEDTSNDNSHQGTIFPNTSNTSPSRTRLSFCLFQSSGERMAGFPSLFPGFEYGVFAGPDTERSLADGTVFTDDEDTSNGNELQASPADLLAIGDIIGGGKNTYMHLAKVR